MKPEQNELSSEEIIQILAKFWEVHPETIIKEVDKKGTLRGYVVDRPCLSNVRVVALLDSKSLRLVFGYSKTNMYNNPKCNAELTCLYHKDVKPPESLYFENSLMRELENAQSFIDKFSDELRTSVYQNLLSIMSKMQ